MDKDIENANKILYIINITKGMKTEYFCKCDLVFCRIVIYLLQYRFGNCNFFVDLAYADEQVCIG